MDGTCEELPTGRCLLSVGADPRRRRDRASGVGLSATGYGVSGHVLQRGGQQRRRPPLAPEPPLSVGPAGRAGRTNEWLSSASADLDRAQPGDQRAQGLPVLAYPVEEPGVDGVGLEAVRPVGDELLAAQQLDPRVVGVVAARRGLEPVAADLEAVLLELASAAARAPCRTSRRPSPRGSRPAAGRRRRRSRRRRACRARRSRRTSRSTARHRRTRPGGSCRASCPWRSARRGRGGTPSRGRTPARARRPAPSSAPRPTSFQTALCAPPRRTWCCPSRGRRRSRARRRGIR